MTAIHFHKPTPWDRRKALNVALSSGGRVVIDWRWRMDQRRGVCQRAAKDKLLRRVKVPKTHYEDGKPVTVMRWPTGMDIFEITEAGKQWLKDNPAPKRTI